MNGLDIFTGIGGITMALQSYVTPITYVEIDPYCQSVLLQRMQEGNLPKAPIWDDIRTFPKILDFSPDIIYGGFPCQDISVAGNQKGLEGKRSGLFFEMLRLIDETKAPFIFLENVPNIRTKGAERVCKELAERGYDSRWCMLSASDVGARHKRERWFLLAHSDSERNTGLSIGKKETYSELGSHSENVSNSESIGAGKDIERIRERSSGDSWFKQRYWTVEPNVGRVVNGLPHRVDRIKALGNSVVPLQVREAFRILLGEIYEGKI